MKTITYRHISKRIQQANRTVTYFFSFQKHGDARTTVGFSTNWQKDSRNFCCNEIKSISMRTQAAQNLYNRLLARDFASDMEA